MTAATMTHEPTISLPAKPKLRGWLHLGMAPVIQIASLVLLVLTPTLIGRVGVAVYLVTATVLFATHDQDLVARSGMPVLHLERGRLVAQGTRR